MYKANFKVDQDKCIGCGQCLNVCPGNMVGGDVLRMEDNHPVMVDETSFGWKGCWRCQHCLAICPTGAISIFGIDPEQVSPKPNDSIKEDLNRLMRYRRSCRDFKKEEVDKKTIDEIVEAVANVPTGGNNNRLEFSVIYTRDAMRKLFEIVRAHNKQLSLLDTNDEDDFSEMRLYDASHLFIAHKPVGDRFRDGDYVEINIASAYFELLANAYGLGTILSTYCAELLSSNKEALKFLEIPEDHTFMTVVGFGYPKYPYARGIDKIRKTHKID